MEFTHMGNLKRLEFPKRMLQKCPLCGEEQPVFIYGMIRDIENRDKITISTDKGYSFCNCNNIFYTDCGNMASDYYDDDYKTGYGNPDIEILAQHYVKNYFHLFNGKKSFLEIGCTYDYLLECAEQYGMNPTGLDINESVHSKYKFITGNFETVKIDEKFDAIWASHVFEHFKKPLNAMAKAYNILEDGGRIFIAMPDPFFINHNNVHSWQHWHVKEHHIMWDMESFIDKMEMIGFKCILKERNIDPHFICTGDYHLVFNK